MVRYHNQWYSQAWANVFMPVSTFFIQLGHQIGITTYSATNDHSILTPNKSSSANGHVAHGRQENHGSIAEPSSSFPLSTFFSTLTSSLRPLSPSTNGVQRKYRAHFKKRTIPHSKKNGSITFRENDSTYHELNIHLVNDDNKNDLNNSTGSNKMQTTTSTDAIIHMVDIGPAYPNVPSRSHTDEEDDDDRDFKPLLPLSMPIKVSKFQLDQCQSEHLRIIVLSSLYFVWFTLIVGINIGHVLIFTAILLCYVVSERTRRWILALMIYLGYLFLYDSMRVLPNHTVSKIHTKDVYTLEKKLFGVRNNGELLTLNEYFQRHHNPVLDVLCGCFYLNWIPVPVAYSLFLYRCKGKREYMDFAFTFLLTNIIGFIIYYIIPTAPPWYIELYGFEVNIKVPGNPAGFIYFDQITGIKIFSSMYSKNANVFAAIPSLHAAYPVLTILYGSWSKKPWLHILFVFFTLGVWFSAVYSRHHYLIDVLLGGFCSVTAFGLYRLLSRVPAINRLIVAYSKVI